ncbi:MAG: MFS transporter [Dysgonamonadaceae bacterium]|nr:MFS transporter [Dysgonamonadaceae bacterium]MDD3309069.1 MFS transporter [Dysgonamonadaceae bacterium]MDD3899873.1 MFS transporter [Dysgonamonadaceae bacterium]
MNKTNRKAQLSIMMFLQYFIQGSWFVTMGTYLGQTLHFSGVQIGLAYGTAAIAAIISPVIVGIIADRFFSPNRVLVFLNFLGSLLLFGLTRIEQFSLFLPTLLAYTICFMPTMSLCNSISFENLKDTSKEFSRIRLFGSFGWIVAGLILSVFDLETLSTPFLIASSVSFLAGLYALLLPYKKPEKVAEKVTVGQILGFDAFKLTKDRSFSVLLIFMALICIPLAFYDSFANLFIVDEGINNAAAAMSLGQIAEVVFLFTFPFLFKKLKYKGSVVAAIVAWIIMYGSFVLGSFTGTNGFLYAVLPFHGFCFTFFFVTGQIYVDQEAPSSLRNSAQGLIAFATYGVGKLLGTIVAGNVVDHYSEGGAYNWVSIWTIPFALAIFFLIGFVLLFREKRR